MIKTKQFNGSGAFMIKIKQFFHRFFYLCYLLLLLLGLVFFHHYFFFLALLLSIFLPVSSLLLIGYVKRILRCQFTFPPHPVMRESELLITLSLPGLSFPVPFIELLFSVQPPYSDSEDSYVIEASMLRNTKTTLSISYPVAHCGYLKVVFHGIRIHGYFNLVTLTKNCEEVYQVMVLPRKMDVPPIEPAFGGSGTETYADSSKKGNDASEPSDIREYQPGDRIQKIHWKMSVKQDTLLVKEYSGTTGKEMVLLVELSPEPDHVFDLLYSYSLFLLDHTWHFYVKWWSISSNSFQTAYVESEQDLLDTLSYLYYEPYDTKNSAVSLPDLESVGNSTVLYLKSGEEYGTWISI